MASGEGTGKPESNENQAAPPRRVIKRRGTAQPSGQKSPLSTPKGKIPSTSSSSDVGMTSDTLQELLSAADEEEASRPKGRPRRLRSNSPSIEKETETMKITVSLQPSPPHDQENVEGNDSKIDDPDESRDGDAVKTQEGEGGDGEVAESNDVDMSKATESLRIEGFTRPLPTKALQEMLQKYGKVVSFWLQGVKKFCMVTYENKEQAAAALSAIDGTSWPEETRPKLTASFIPTQEVQEALAAKSQVKPNEKESRPTKALDELFRRTKAKPVIYWLPLTAEEIARKEKENNSDRNKREKDKEKKSKQEEQRSGKRRRDSSQSKKKSKSRSPSKHKKNGTKVDVPSKDSVKVEPGSPKPATSQSTDNKSDTTKRSSSPSRSKPTTKSKAKKKKSASSSSSPSRSKSSSPERPKSKKSR